MSASVRLVRALPFVAALASCVAGGAAAQDGPGLTGAAAEAPMLIDRVVAVVDEEAILQSELEREIAIWRLERGQAGDTLAMDDATVRQEVLDRLVESKLMIAAAKQAEIQVEDAEVEQDVEENISQLVRHFGSQEGLERELARNGMNLADYRARTAAQVRDRRYMAAVVTRYVRSKVEVREDEVEAYWNAHADEIPAAPDSVRLASILVAAEPSEAARLEVQRKVGAVLQELGEGKPFPEVARRQTEGPNAERGGAMGVVRRGELFDRRLEDAVWSLRPGEVSRPILTGRGVHLVRLDAVEGEGRVISQIFFPLEIGAAEVQAARERAQDAWGRLQGGEPFAKVAAEVSADPAAAQGGDMGILPLDGLSDRFREALAGKQAGQFTEPVQTPAGFYLLLVKERLPGRRPTFAEVRDMVRRALESERVEAELARYVAGLRGRFYVDIRG